MTLKRYTCNRFALVPKVCGKCDRRFVLELYRISFKSDYLFGKIKSLECSKCTEERNGD